MSYNKEVLKICHLKGIVPRWEVLLFTKKVSSLRQAGLRDMFQMAFKSFCASTVVISPNTLSPTLSTSSAVKTLEGQNTQKRILMTLNQQLKDVSKWCTPVISSAAQA
jgi:hypothetical protein